MSFSYVKFGHEYSWPYKFDNSYYGPHLKLFMLNLFKTKTKAKT